MRRSKSVLYREMWCCFIDFVDHIFLFEGNEDDIRRLGAEGWVITFMGTTEEAVNKAVSLGISRGNTMTYMDSAAGMADSFESISSVRTAHYSMSKTMLGASLSEQTEIKKKMDNLLSKEKLDDK